MLGIDRAGASHLCLLVLCLLWGRGDTAWPVSRDLLDGASPCLLGISSFPLRDCFSFIGAPRGSSCAQHRSNASLCADSNLSVVKGSGSLASKQFMGDYTKNLTQAASPVYGPVQYTYDAVGDTQGAGACPVHCCCALKFRWYGREKHASLSACLIEARMPAGEENFIAQTYDFVVADMPLTQAQLKTCNRCVSTPMQAIALRHVKLQHVLLSAIEAGLKMMGEASCICEGIVPHAQAYCSDSLGSECSRRSTQPAR